MVRKKYPKEGTVFQIHFSTFPFFRDDHSVDLYKARHAVITELQKIVEEVRDYYWGMIMKQIELFNTLKQKLGDLSRKDALLLEVFFHALFSIEMRSVLKPSPLKKFLIWKDILTEHKPSILIEQEMIFAMSSHDCSTDFQVLQLAGRQRPFNCEA